MTAWAAKFCKSAIAGRRTGALRCDRSRRSRGACRPCAAAPTMRSVHRCPQRTCGGLQTGRDLGGYIRDVDQRLTPAHQRVARLGLLWPRPHEFSEKPRGTAGCGETRDLTVIRPQIAETASHSRVAFRAPHRTPARGRPVKSDDAQHLGRRSLPPVPRVSVNSRAFSIAMTACAAAEQRSPCPRTVAPPGERLQFARAARCPCEAPRREQWAPVSPPPPAQPDGRAAPSPRHD